MQKHPTHKMSKGFTLIELLIAIAIIGILASVAIPKYSQYKIRGYDAHSKQALKDMHLLCNAYWLDTDALQGCDLPKIKEVTYGFNQNADVVATLPSSPLNNFCASAKHNSSPNTYSIDSASLISDTGDCKKAERVAAQEPAVEKAAEEACWYDNAGSIHNCERVWSVICEPCAKCVRVSEPARGDPEVMCEEGEVGTLARRPGESIYDARKRVRGGSINYTDDRERVR